MRLPDIRPYMGRSEVKKNTSSLAPPCDLEFKQPFSSHTIMSCVEQVQSESYTSRTSIAPHKIISITGHKNVASVSNYDSEIHISEHQNLSNILFKKSSTK